MFIYCKLKIIKEGRLEAQDIQSETYAETPFIKMASNGNWTDDISILATVPLPYYFNSTFDASVSSASDMKNGNSTTVRITANYDWVTSDFPKILDPSQRYYDITLYANGVSQGTYRFLTGGWRHADWTGVPIGATLSFRMTKPQQTWSTGVLDGRITGSGEVLNP